MTALIGDTPTARRELGDYWRDRIEQELDRPGDNGIAERIYGILATLPNRPTYQIAWDAVVSRCDLESDVRRQYYQTIFDLIWQTLCDKWGPGQEENHGDVRAFTLTPVSVPVAA